MLERLCLNQATVYYIGVSASSLYFEKVQDNHCIWTACGKITHTPDAPHEPGW
jgi:hypothetical protein